MRSVTAPRVRSPSVARKRTRDLPASGTVPITFRLDVAVARNLDAEAARVNAANPGLKVERTDIVRMLIAEALAARAKSRAK